MRILVVSIGTYGDVLPFIGMAAELRKRGHDVTLASAETFEPAARRAGVPFEPIMTLAEYKAVFEHPDFWRPFVGARRLFRALPTFLQPTYDFIARRNQPGRTVIVASSLSLGARAAQEALRIPMVSVHLMPILLPSRDLGPRPPFLRLPDWAPAGLKWQLQTGLFTHFIDPLLLPGLNAFRRTIGLPPRRHTRTWWNSPQRILMLCPEWFAPRQADWPSQVRQFDFPRADLIGAQSATLDPELERFLAAGEKPVAITFGSARFATDAMYRSAVAACMSLGKRCVLLSHQPIDLPAEMQGYAFAARYAPLGEVLPRCAALIHHGGIGTTASAFSAGIPQLVVPIAFDQFDHAERVKRIGCGDSVYRRRFTPGRAARRLSRLLTSEEIAGRCAAIAAHSGQGDAIADICDSIEREGAFRLRRKRLAAGA